MTNLHAIVLISVTSTHVVFQARGSLLFHHFLRCIRNGKGCDCEWHLGASSSEISWVWHSSMWVLRLPNYLGPGFESRPIGGESSLSNSFQERGPVF
jgi:hypothetical protein